MKQVARLIASTLLAAAIGLCVTSPAQAALIDDLNQIRLKGCGKQPAAPLVLRASVGLDAVAREWSRGGRLRDAIDKARYPLIRSASMRIQGTSDDALILRKLSQSYCESIVDPDFTEIGLYRRGSDAWIVVASAFTPPLFKDASRIAGESLRLVNQARAQARRCGNANFPAVPPLTSSSMLARAALIQAQDMATHSHFEHEGTDGSTPAQRVTRAGYQWRSVAENIASGPSTAQQVIQGWIDSPGHCANMMSASSTQMGIAFATNPKDSREIYWSQVFASPR